MSLLLFFDVIYYLIDVLFYLFPLYIIIVLTCDLWTGILCLWCYEIPMSFY